MYATALSGGKTSNIVAGMSRPAKHPAFAPMVMFILAEIALAAIVALYFVVG